MLTFTGFMFVGGNIAYQAYIVGDNTNKARFKIKSSCHPLFVLSPTTFTNKHNYSPPLLVLSPTTLILNVL